MTDMIIILAILCGLLAVWAEYSRTLLMLQLNSYRSDRYNRYLKQSGEMTSWDKLAGLILFFIALISQVPDMTVAVGQALFFAIAATAQLRRKYKKPLVRTARVWRLTAVMCLLTMALILIFALGKPIHPALYAKSTTLLGCWFASPWVALTALWLLNPVEKAISNGYIRDAQRILASMPSLKVVGITGSYGKTSTKHYLQRILQEKYSVCITPGSYNTTMGVVRTIREYLKPYDEVFICEMGAKQPGDIAEICALVHPTIGIVTAVGPQHLESFKSIENVQRTKFELIDSLPEDGLAVLNNDFEHVASRKVTAVETARYGIDDNDAEYRADNIEYSPDGTSFTLHTPHGDLGLHTRLLGQCNVSNLIAAVIVGLKLGVTPEQIQHAVQRIDAVEHRLSRKCLPGGVIVLDDAFNSNPAGADMALDVLSSMPGTRIVITPGMIELGDRQHELNRSLGEKISQCADMAIVVGQYNRQAITEGLEGSGIRTEAVDTLQQAVALLPPSNYTVLYENDLPDNFK